MTDRDFEILAELIAAYDRQIVLTQTLGWDLEKTGVAPIECGGTNGSDHSHRLTKLAIAGFAEQRKRGLPWRQSPTAIRGSKLYRPTRAGRMVLEEWQLAGGAGWMRVREEFKHE